MPRFVNCPYKHGFNNQSFTKRSCSNLNPPAALLSVRIRLRFQIEQWRYFLIIENDGEITHVKIVQLLMRGGQFFSLYL